MSERMKERLRQHSSAVCGLCGRSAHQAPAIFFQIKRDFTRLLITFPLEEYSPVSPGQDGGCPVQAVHRPPGPGLGAARLETEDSSYESGDEDIFFTPNTSFSEEDLD